ncbi:MAG: M23 family metallopeptidase [Gammaproteobacteria bacterium]|nr:M23 family metallopeptidase [Gammaproteobacteria bacterium]
MRILFLSEARKCTGSIDISIPRAAALGGLAVVGLGTVMAWGAYLYGQQHAIADSGGATNVEMRAMLEAERREIADAKAEQRAHLDALALKVAELQAHLMRLDALGDRLVEVGKLDREEFDFSTQPPVGGVDDTAADDSQTAVELSAEMAQIARTLADREQKLDALEWLLMSREVMAEVLPSGKPVKKGWLSSGFGKRTDPFNGKKSYHRGVDFAGKPGSDVVAVASGVVTRAERVPGYGNVVEIRHADGYSTRYAHNKKNLVDEGDVVSKGHTIALLGSTGRSSGPHVHFEVHRNGKVVNPARFLRPR